MSGWQWVILAAIAGATGIGMSWAKAWASQWEDGDEDE